MSRDKSIHLSPEEISRLVEEEFGPLSVAEWADREPAGQHAAACGLCGPQLQAQRSVQASLRSLVGTVIPERTSGCPPEGKWLPLAAGVCPAEEAGALLEHASGCDYCGHLLRETTEALGPELSAGEKEIAGQLASSRPEWQESLAKRMAEASAPAKGMAVVYETSRGKLFGILPRWAMAMVALLLVAAGAGVWYQLSQPSLTETNRLIAQAYTEQRPFEMRFEGAAYGPVRQQMGGRKLQPVAPPELLDAKLQVLQRLSHNPDNPEWLQAKARIELCAGNYEEAINVLERAKAALPDNASIHLDLATAYFEHGEADGEVNDSQSALQLLNNILLKDPQNKVALFNRAIINDRQQRRGDAVSDWQRYLELDQNGKWADEVREHLK